MYHDPIMSIVEFGSSLHWFRPAKLAKTARPKLPLAISPSLLDLLPPELLTIILEYLDLLDLQVLSLCSKSWLTKAWAFTTSIDFRPFYHASTQQSAFCLNLNEFSSVSLHNDTHGYTTRIDIARALHSSKPRSQTAAPQTSHELAHNSAKRRKTQEVSESLPFIGGRPRKHQNSADTRHLGSSSEARASGTNRTPSPWGPSASKSNFGSPPSMTQIQVLAPPLHRDRASVWKTSLFVQQMLTRLNAEQLLEISLAGCPLSPSVFKKIASTSCRATLIALNLENCIGNSASCMSYISRLTGLHYLNLRGCDGMGESSLRHLRTMTNLIYLDLKDILCIKLSTTSHSSSIHPSLLPSSPESLKSSMGNVPGSPSSLDEPILAKLPMFQPERDCGSESEEDVDEISLQQSKLHKRRTEIPLEWYTPANSVFKAVSKLTNLTALYMSEWNSSSSTSDCPLLKSLAHLKILHLQYSMNLKDFCPSMSNLENLSFATRTYANYYVQGAHFSQSSLLNLTTLNFTNCYRLNDAGLDLVVGAAPNLIDLRLCFCDAITDVTIQEVLPKIQKTLRVLDLRHVDALTDEGLVGISKLTNLHSLNLRHISGIQWISCAAFDHLQSLQALDLSFCSNLTTEGLIQIANSRCPIRWLSLRGAKLIQCNAIQTLLSTTKSLTMLDIQDCPSIISELNSSKSLWRQFKANIPPCLQHLYITSSGSKSFTSWL